MGRSLDRDRPGHEGRTACVVNGTRGSRNRPQEQAAGKSLYPGGSADRYSMTASKN